MRFPCMPLLLLAVGCAHAPSGVRELMPRSAGQPPEVDWNFPVSDAFASDAIGPENLSACKAKIASGTVADCTVFLPECTNLIMYPDHNIMQVNVAVCTRARAKTADLNVLLLQCKDAPCPSVPLIAPAAP